MTPKRKAAAKEAHGEAAPRSTLPQLCSDAADHVARARVALHDDSYDADQALHHLDEAISCLRRLYAHGCAANGHGAPADLRSA